MTDLAATRAFFGPRAAGWEDRFPDDGPAYRRAVTELGPRARRGRRRRRLWHRPRTATAARRRRPGRHRARCRRHRRDAGRGPRRDRATVATLLLADATRLPLPSGRLDAVFAAGLVTHLPDPVTGLAELARVCRDGGRLALFHPVGRAALARRQGRALDPDEVRSPARIRVALAEAGWRCDGVDDADERYLVLATR